MLNKLDIENIAWRLSRLKDCPNILTYHDLKDELGTKSNLSEFFKVKENKEELFASEEVSPQLKFILDEISSDLDPEDRRRIAIFHAMVQFPKVRRKISKKELNNAIEIFLLESGKNENAYIFLHALKAITVEDNDSQIESRKNLRMISEILEPEYDNDSLFNHFMQMIEHKIILTKVPDRMHYVARGGQNREINGFWALNLLFGFEGLDFTDTEWIGGLQEFGFTEFLSLRKRKILNHIQALRECNLPESIDYLS